MKKQSLYTLIVGLQLLASIAVAGGGGTCPEPHSGDILVCHAQGPTSAQVNVVGMNVYHTDGCGGLQRTFAQFDLVDHDLSYNFQTAMGIDATGATVLGH